MASLGFRWLDILEKEFDKAFVDLDLTIGELESEEPVIVYNVRQKLCTLSSCFAQLTHKAQTIFQNSAKIEAELIHMRAELVDSKTKQEVLEQELHNLLLQLHSTQLSRIPKTNGTLFKVDANFKPDVSNIRKKLEEEIRRSPSHIIKSNSGDNKLNGFEGLEFNVNLLEMKQLQMENAQLKMENVSLRNSVLALNSEVYGAKLAAKYLDKELAGRIQQLQLLGKEMKGDVRDKLWRQLESEILLQRHKTVVRECRRNCILNSVGGGGGGGGSEKENGNGRRKKELPVPLGSEKAEHFGDVRTVVVKRKPGQGLGISITGGREHGVPILISELEQNGPAALSGQLFIGDAILSVNERDLRQACHKEAVDILKQHSEECRLQVQYVAADDSDNSLEEDGFNFRFFDNDICDATESSSITAPVEAATTPTAPRTPPEAAAILSGGAARISGINTEGLLSDPSKIYRVSPEIQRVIDSLQTKEVHNLNVNTMPNSIAKDFTLTAGINAHFLNMNNEINRNSGAKFDTAVVNDLILLDNRRLPCDNSSSGAKNKTTVLNNLNCSSNSLNSENLSSPMQTSTDMFLDSEVLSTDVASNDSHSPKTNDNMPKECKFEEMYASNETFSNTKSDQSLLNSSCDSSPVHKGPREHKKTKKKYSKKYFGVKTLQNIFNKHDGYSDISSNASDGTDEHLDLETNKPSVCKIPLQTPKKINSKEESKGGEESGDKAETTTYKYRTILTETSPQFEENIHTFLSEIFMKNFQAPDAPENAVSTSRIGTKRYLRVGKALRLCPNEDNANGLSELEKRREKLLARYVYNSNSLGADGEGNPDFGTPV